MTKFSFRQNVEPGNLTHTHVSLSYHQNRRLTSLTKRYNLYILFIRVPLFVLKGYIFGRKTLGFNTIESEKVRYFF